VEETGKGEDYDFWLLARLTRTKDVTISPQVSGVWLSFSRNNNIITQLLQCNSDVVERDIRCEMSNYALIAYLTDKSPPLDRR
jgi:hypothetical protein